MFIYMKLRELQVILHAPESATGGAQAGLNRRAHILRRFALEPRAAASDGCQRMGIAIAHLGPAVDLAVNVHGNAVGSDAAKAGVPGLDTVQPDIVVRVNAIKD